MSPLPTKINCIVINEGEKEEREKKFKLYHQKRVNRIETKMWKPFSFFFADIPALCFLNIIKLKIYEKHTESEAEKESERSKL